MTPAEPRSQFSFGVIAIGRNEGERLHGCLRSIPSNSIAIYVDSGSTDGSAIWARRYGVEVAELDLRVPFTAARARNVGVRRLRELAPEIPYVQFIDGDCELITGWVEHAVRFLDAHSDVGAVTGRLRERYPERSVYNWLCEREWDGPTGEVRVCGGIVMMRLAAFAAAGGFRDDLIAGEEPELCVRLRAAGWRIWRTGTDMALHDAAMVRFSQWWTRAVRTGHAFAEGAYLHGAGLERCRVGESGGALFWGLFLPPACLLASLWFWPWGSAAWLIYPLQMLRQIARNRGSLRQRALLALFQAAARFPESLGHIRFLRDRMLGRQSRLIEYK